MPSSALRLLVVLFAASVALAPRAAHAQQSSSLGESIERVGEDYAALYVQPVVDAVGANLNSGLFHKSKVGGGLLPLVDVYVGVKAFGTLVPDEDRSLSLDYQATEQVEYQGETYEADVTYEIDEAPTAFGEQEPGTVTGTAVFRADGERREVERTLDLLPGALNTSVAPLAVPQAGVGIPMLGTHVSVRYLPRINFGDYGSVQFAGAGLRHEVSSYIPLLPFALSAHGFYQSLSIAEEDESEIVNASAYAVGVSASKSLLLATVYGGLQLERTTADVDYTFDPGDNFDPQTISFGLTGENTFRVLAGVSVGLGPAALNVDFSQGQRSVLSAGLGVSL